MGFIENQVGLAQQAAKANAYDQMLAARDAEYMASQYANAGFQKGVETALRGLPREPSLKSDRMENHMCHVI